MQCPIDHAQSQTRDARLGAAFAAHVKVPSFPCVGAKSALARGTLNIVPCRDIASSWDDLTMHRELLVWSQAYAKDPSGFRSLAFVFREPFSGTETEFETALWQRIQSLSDKDEWSGQSYDSAVSPDPDDPHFGLSFGGEAYFVVGMHAQASRPARRFQRPVMVFNLHDQFVRLREQNQYARMREAILDRDRQLAGDINPMLAVHGESSEAKQYSGRQVEHGWRAPFVDKREKKQDTP